MTSLELIKLLREQAKEVHIELLAGWGNTMILAADKIEYLEAELEDIRSAWWGINVRKEDIKVDGKD